MTERPREGQPDPKGVEQAESILEAFNAGGVIEHPNDPEAAAPDRPLGTTPGTHGSPASDADAPAPPG